MDKIFEEIISTNVEVYVDDMVVKSTAATDHCRALERVFQVLRRHRLKLNPEKCSFRAEKAMSVAIVQEREGKQHPVYFISKETSPLLLGISRDRLNRLPIKQVLRKPDLARRMVTWSVQLSKFNISYKSRSHIKAQVLANFITKMAASGQETEENNRWFLSVDGASNQLGSGTGVILEGPNRSLHFKFKVSNNQAEYETLLAGMKLAKELEARTLTAKSDSKLVTGQLATTYKRGVQRSVNHESVSQLIVEESTVYCAKERRTWMSPLMTYLKNEKLLSDPNEAKKIVRDATKYIIIKGELYRRGFSFPLLRCVEGNEARYVVREVHEGVCDIHIGGLALANKIARVDYYWPTLKNDCMEYVKRCDRCQRFFEVNVAP
ncbi:hypothetical protein CR513_35952, partial [Mucuna pruriens]